MGVWPGRLEVSDGGKKKRCDELRSFGSESALTQAEKGVVLYA